MRGLPFGWVGHGGLTAPNDEWVGFVLFGAAPDERTRQRLMSLAPRLLRKKPAWQGSLLRMRKRGFMHLVGDAYGRGPPAELTAEQQAEFDAFPPEMREWIERERSAAGGTVNLAAFSRELYHWLESAHEIVPVTLFLVATEPYQRELLTELHQQSLVRMVACVPRIAELLDAPDPRIAQDFSGHILRYASRGPGTVALGPESARALSPLVRPPLGIDEHFDGMKRVLEHLSDADYEAAAERLAPIAPALISAVDRGAAARE